MNLLLQSLFDRIHNPVYQAVLAFFLEILLLLFSYVAGLAGWLDYSARIPWILAGTFVLFYALFSSVFSLGAKDMNRYWFLSTSSYAALVFLSSLVAYFFSAMTISEAGSFRFIFIVLTFGYLLFLSIMRALRKIVQLAQHEDDSWKKRL